jgi:hypothetical protein
MVAAFIGFAKAAFLGIMGVIGVFAWDDVTNPWGIGALVLGAFFALASWGLLRGAEWARVVLAGLAAIGGVLALVYVFVGPSSAILPSLFTVLLAAIVIALLYAPQASKEYFAS